MTRGGRLTMRAVWSLLLALPLAAPAQEGAGWSRLSLERLLALEVSSVSRFPQSALDAPAAVRVVDDADIRAFGYRTVADALRSLPGTDVTSDRTYNFLGVRGYNRPGDYGSRVLLMVDGLRTNDGIYNQALFGSEAILDTPILKRIEYFAGPSSSLYGANALFGAVNLVTKTGADIDGWESRLEVGNHRSQRAGLTFGRRLADGRDLVAYASLAHSGGENVHFPEHGGTARGIDSDRYAKFFAKYSDGGVRVSGAYSRRTKENPAAPYGTLFGEPAPATDEQGFLEAAWESAAGEGLTRLVRGYANHYRYEADWHYAGPPDYLNRDQAVADSIGGEYRLTWRGRPNHVLVGGVEWRQDYRLKQRNFDVDPPATYLDVSHHATAVGAYVQDEWRLSERWLLNAGLRYDRVSDYRGEWSPRIAVIWRPDPVSALKFLAGRAFRPPNQSERFYSDGGISQKPNPGLRPERITTWEVVGERRIDDQLRLAASLFRYHFDHVVELGVDPADGVGRYANGAATRAMGTELEADWRLAAGGRLKGSLTFQDARGAGDARLTNSPRVLGKFQAYLPDLLGWDAGLEWLVTGQRKTEAGAVPGYGIGNLTLNRPLSRDSELRLGIVNLADRRYRDPAPSYYSPVGAMPQPRRQAYLQWSGRF